MPPQKIVVPVGSSNEMTKASANLAINIYNYAHTDTDIYKSLFLQTTIQASIASSFKKWWPTSFLDQKFHLSWMRHKHPK
jgi:hypothetical protein